MKDVVIIIGYFRYEDNDSYIITKNNSIKQAMVSKLICSIFEWCPKFILKLPHCLTLYCFNIDELYPSTIFRINIISSYLVPIETTLPLTM